MSAVGNLELEMGPSRLPRKSNYLAHDKVRAITTSDDECRGATGLEGA